MKLSFAGPEDAPRLEAAHAKAFDTSWTAEDIARLMQIMGGFALTAEEGEEVLGFILVRVIGGEGEILTLAVAPSARRRGVGTALIEAALAEAGRRGAETLFLEVSSENFGALALYGRIGFEHAGLRRAYYSRTEAPPGDALVLRLPLNRPGG